MKHSRKLLCTAIASVVAAGTALAVPVVDGINTGGSEYTNSQAWDFYSSHNPQKGVMTGTMSWEIDASTLYLLIAAPVTYVDNIFGVDALLPGSGYDSKGHAFDKLLKSDGLELALDTTGDGLENFNLAIDYLDDATGTQAILDTKKNTYTGTVDVASSLEYNLALGGVGTSDCVRNYSGGVPVDSENGAGCEAQVMYELSLDLTDSELANWGGAFNPADVIEGDATCTTASDGKISCTGASGSQLHASPNKIASTTPPPSVPEPSTLALLLAGFPGVLWARRRKRIRK